MTMFGMNPVAVNGVTEDLSRLATLVKEQSQQLSTLVAALPWQGDDADAALVRWLSTIQPALALLAIDLAHAAEQAGEHVAEQHRASSG